MMMKKKKKKKKQRATHLDMAIAKLDVFCMGGFANSYDEMEGGNWDGE